MSAACAPDLQLAVLRLRALPRGFGLRHGLLGLRDLFGARAGFQLRQLRLRHSQRRFRLSDRQLRIDIVEPGDHIAGFHRVAALHFQLDNRPAGAETQVGPLFRQDLAGSRHDGGQRLRRT